MERRTNLICDNANSNGSGITVKPQCFRNRALYKVTVRYNEAESDTANLCEECMQALKKDAEPRGYKITAKEL
jgi:hypothetical protein